MHRLQKSENIIKKALIFAGFSAMLFAMPAYAYNQAVLTGIEINSLNNNSYQINLKTDKTVPVEKEISNDNKIILDVKNVKLANFVNTVYNNATQIDNVIIHPGSNNEVRIFISGTNVASSMIHLKKPDYLAKNNNSDSEAAAPQKDSNVDEQNANTDSGSSNNIEPLPKSITDNINKNNNQQEEQTVVIHPPVSSFKPVDTYDDAVNESVDFQHSKIFSNKIVKKLLGESLLAIALRLTGLIVLLFAIVKIFMSKKKSIKLDLYSNTREQELEMLKIENNKRSSRLPEFGDASKISSTRINPELNIRSKYGLGAYQNSQKPSFMNSKKVPAPLNTSKRSLNRDNREIGMSHIKNDIDFTQIKNKKPSTQKINSEISNISTSRITNRDINSSRVSVNGVKFLENMAKIYERSGREDLAMGIQNNITRARF